MSFQKRTIMINFPRFDQCKVGPAFVRLYVAIIYMQLHPGNQKRSETSGLSACRVQHAHCVCSHASSSQKVLKRASGEKKNEHPIREECSRYKCNSGVTTMRKDTIQSVI